MAVLCVDFLTCVISTRADHLTVMAGGYAGNPTYTSKVFSLRLSYLNSRLISENVFRKLNRNN